MGQPLFNWLLKFLFKVIFLWSKLFPTGPDHATNALQPQTPEPNLPGPACLDTGDFEDFEDQLMEADSLDLVPAEDELPDEPLQVALYDYIDLFVDDVL